MLPWKLDYLNLERIPAEELARRRREFDEQKAVARDAAGGEGGVRVPPPPGPLPRGEGANP